VPEPLHAPIVDRPVIWVVDDSPLERALTIAVLQPDYVFEEFDDGAQLIERVARGGPLPDVVVLDWVMPGVAGDDVCRFLRSQPHTADLPIVVVTASRVETQDIVHGLALGANDYVARPFAAEELRARIQTVIRSKELGDAASRERARLATVNQLGRALFRAGTNIETIFDEALSLITDQLADGCGITLIPGELPPISVAVHRKDPTGSTLAPIISLADPVTLAFDSDDDAIARLPPMYHAYIRQHGLRALAILPFPVRGPIHGVVTATRDRTSAPFAPDDIATLETCIEYVSLAVQNAVRFEAERNARGQLHTILAHAPVGLLVADDAGVIQLVNPAAARMVPGLEHARTLEEARGQTEFTTIDGKPTELAGSTFERSVVALQLGTTKKVLAVTMAEIRDGDRVRGSVTAIEDVTIQHALAAERERIAAFQQQMLGIVGHDLRNPLSAIMSGAELIRVQADASKIIQSTATRVLASAQRMANLVAQLLDMTRARLGHGIPVAFTDTALAPLIRSVVDELAIAHSDRMFELVARDMRAHVDPDRIAQVVSNLVGNAVRYGDPSKPIYIELAEANEHARLSVRNAVNGSPIPPALLATLFEAFRQGNDPGAHRTGLGLGLFITSEIVRAHRGTISARSTTDEGTVFTVELPLRRQV
jgi:phosphoserine phosphatase RsbU/P